jgi:hypothetical protein
LKRRWPDLQEETTANHPASMKTFIRRSGKNPLTETNADHKNALKLSIGQHAGVPMNERSRDRQKTKGKPNLARCRVATATDKRTMAELNAVHENTVSPTIHCSMKEPTPRRSRADGCSIGCRVPAPWAVHPGINARSQDCSLKRRWPDRQEETTAIQTPPLKASPGCPQKRCQPCRKKSTGRNRCRQ